MNTRVRGLIVFGVIILVAVVACGLIPFVIMPSMGIGMALPVIEVPGEVVVKNGLLGQVDLTNTLIGTFLADIMVIIFAVLAWRASKGWTKEVPGRFQAFAETIIEGFYNFMKGVGGARLRTAPLLWPLVGTIFLFLLAGNILKLFPGVETVGKAHCAHVDMNGYPMVKGATDGTYLLFVDSALNAGTPQTVSGEHACEAYFSEGGLAQTYPTGFAIETPEEIATQATAMEARIAELSLVGEETLNDDARKELMQAEAYVAFAAERSEAAEKAAELSPQVEGLRALVAAVSAAPAAEEHSEDAAATTEEAHSEDTIAAEEAAATALNDATTRLDALEAELNLAQSQVRFPGATMALNSAQLERGAIPYIFHITPFVRGPATDLSLTIALAILSIVAVQIYGVIALGPAYFEKFINISALGNLGKKPLGAIDFIVGLIEIISEIGKIISLAFRLFGNLFAGGVALIAISFLVAVMVPGVIYLLEIVIGMVQALVFSVLTLVFAVQAMESHHGDEHEHAEEGHHEAAH